MSNFDFKNLEDSKAEEKRLHDEYKAKISELKKYKNIIEKIYLNIK